MSSCFAIFASLSDLTLYSRQEIASTQGFITMLLPDHFCDKLSASWFLSSNSKQKLGEMWCLASHKKSCASNHIMWHFFQVFADLVEQWSLIMLCPTHPGLDKQMDSKCMWVEWIDVADQSQSVSLRQRGIHSPRFDEEAGDLGARAARDESSFSLCCQYAGFVTLDANLSLVWLVGLFLFRDSFKNTRVTQNYSSLITFDLLQSWGRPGRCGIAQRSLYCHGLCLRGSPAILFYEKVFWHWLLWVISFGFGGPGPTT